MASTSTSTPVGSAAAPPPLKDSFLRRNKFLLPMILALNLSLGAYLFMTKKKDVGTEAGEVSDVPSSSVASTAAITAVAGKQTTVPALVQPAVVHEPIPEDQQRELMKWILEEKRKLKPKDPEEKKRIDISKNLLFLATVTPKAMGDIGSVTPDDSWLFVYLVDTITGRVLLRMSHHGCQGPVHAVFSENWVVYHYFNLRAHRYEMSVVEIYDQSRADNKDVLKLVLGKHNLSAPVSSYSRPEIMTKSQSYFFTHSVKAVAVTSTAKGITSKQLLIGTIGDQVLALDKRFLDPRRSLNPTQAEKEEGIMPLTDTLPIMPQAFVTHALKVEGLRSIIAIPAKLESTTLIFAHGVDLFFTRLAPSKTYDSLTDDFNYALLLLTIVALVISIFVTWIWSERKDLQEKWR